MSVAKYIDHTALKPNTNVDDIVKLCEEARDLGFRGVCVNPYWLPLVKRQLRNFDIKSVVVVDFPLGAGGRLSKLAEVDYAIGQGADEIDVVWNLGAFKSKKPYTVMSELQSVVVFAHEANIFVKVIVETCYLNKNELIDAYQIVTDSGADCIKTSTGFGSAGATITDIANWKKLGGLKIKASGGISTYAAAQKFIEIGADIIGTSHGVKIVMEQKEIEEKEGRGKE